MCITLLLVCFKCYYYLIFYFFLKDYSKEITYKEFNKMDKEKELIKNLFKKYLRLNNLCMYIYKYCNLNNLLDVMYKNCMWYLRY